MTDWNEKIRIGPLDTDSGLKEYLAAFAWNPKRLWDECDRGDYLLAAAELNGAPRVRLAEAAREISGMAMDFAASLEKEDVSPESARQILEKQDSGEELTAEEILLRNTIHWQGHLTEALGRCFLSLGEYLHFHGHNGGLYAARVADHYTEALVIAYSKGDGQIRKDRIRGMLKGFQETAHVAKTVLAFDMLRHVGGKEHRVS